MRPLVIANLKSYKLKQEIREWIGEVEPGLVDLNVDAALAAPFPYLYLLENTRLLKRAAQDVSPYPPGSYTGEINAEMLSDNQVSYCIVGHSERRKYFFENYQQISSKIDMLVEHGITPVVCLRSEDITPQLSAISDRSKTSCIFVYEPPEDIGGTTSAPLDKIVSGIERIKPFLSGKQMVGYGGSVNAGNIKALTSLVDCFLIATAALDPESFIETCRNASTN